MNNKIFKNKNFLSVFLAFIIILIILLLNLIKIAQIANNNIQKELFNFSGKGGFDDRIVVVEIDEDAVGKFGRFPFDRKEYVQLIKNLNRAGASVIGLDIIFADKTPSDDLLAKAIKDAGNIVLGGGTLKNSTRGIFEKPRDIFTSGALLVGTLDVTHDSYTNIIFSLHPYKILSNGEYEYFGISLLRGYYNNLLKDKTYLTDKMLKYSKYLKIKDNIILPLSSTNTNDFLINFETTRVKRYSFLDIYDEKNFLGEQEHDGKLFLKDKIVIVGAALRGLDKVKTPIGDDFGVFVHANFINTVLTKNFSKYLDQNLEKLLIFLLIILAIYINLAKSGKILIISNLSILGMIIIYIKILKVLQFIPNFTFELIFAISLSLIISNIVKYILENTDKDKLLTALSQYVSKEVAEEILSGEGNVKLDGEKRRITIFFSDIEGFTTLSEKFEPENLILFLKTYLGEMAELIKLKKGYLDKYEGDAIMAIWGAFGNNNPDISKISCETALLQREKLIELNKKWQKEGIPKINIRIGINTGEAVTGNIGDEKLNYTAIGDNVNLASRLESINKHYGTYICVSESVYNDTKNIFEFRYLDKIKVKGKNIALKIYELLGYKGELKDTKIYIDFEKGINLYLNKEFENALKIFEKLGKLGDAPSIVYKERCLTFIKNSPGDDWDGIWTMLEK